MLSTRRAQYAAAALIVPLSIWGGVKLSNYSISRNLDKMSRNPAATKISDTALKADIVRLAKERQMILEEIDMADERIREMKRRIEQQAARARPS